MEILKKYFTRLQFLEKNGLDGLAPQFVIRGIDT
jgi:hypothetical protein